MVTFMEHTPTWNVEQVWGSDRFYYEGDVASEQIAFIIDSGITQLDDLNVNTEWSKSFVDEFPDPFEDITGHGTAVASIVGAKANEEGLTGVAPGAELVALRVFGDKGWARAGDIEAALEHARDVIVANNLFDRAVVNMSLGGGSPSRHPLVKEMADLGIKFSISAGNSGRDVDGFSPASYGDHENVYTVSSNTESGYYSGFTNFDGVDINGLDDVDYTAPGSRVLTYNTDGTIKYRNGTSFSSPHIAGVLLMSEEVRPGQTFTLNIDQVEKGMVPDPLGMFDPYTYKHGPSTGEPTPDAPPESIPPEVSIPFTPTDEKIKLRGDKFDNILIGGDNRDKLRGHNGNDTLISYQGNDVLRAGKGDDYIDAGTGSDLITGGYGLNTIADQQD
jgi:Ca2+-binding RTX toxin-like protein